MIDLTIGQAIPLALMTGFAGSAATIFVQWMRRDTERHKTDKTVAAQLEEHWTATTLELVETLQSELKEAKAELSSLRPMEARLAHLEEALDHIHALLSAEGNEEKKAAERRAQAFLRRMRGEDTKGARRNEIQTEVSAHRIAADTAQGKHDDD